MTAQDNLQPKQFMPLHEVGKLRSANLKRQGTVDEWVTMHRQLVGEQSDHPYRWAGLNADVARNGVQHPLTVTHEPDGVTLTEGHHRYNAAELAGQKEVPVRHQAKDEQGYITAWKAS